MGGGGGGGAIPGIGGGGGIEPFPKNIHCTLFL